MNVWEDDPANNAVRAVKKKRLLVGGFLTEACVSFPALFALKEGFEVLVVRSQPNGISARISALEAERGMPSGLVGE